MTIHFDTEAAAIADLEAHGFRLIKSGRWVHDGVAASIHPIRNSDKVAVFYREV